jgi:hypothetical protein
MVWIFNSFHQPNPDDLRGSAESSLSEQKGINLPSSELQRSKDEWELNNRSLLSAISLPVNLDQTISGERQNFLKQNLNTAESGTDVQQVLEAFKNITSDNYQAGYLHADYSRLSNHSGLNDLLLREQDEGKLGYALRKFIYSEGSGEKLAEKLGTLFNHLSYGRLGQNPIQKNLVVRLVTRDLENGIYAGIANKASEDKFSSKSGDYLKTMKALGNLDILIECATEPENSSLKKLAEASAKVLFNEISDQMTYLQLDNLLSNDQLKIARGLKISGLNVTESTPMAVRNLTNIINKDIEKILDPASQDLNLSDSLDKASQLVDLIQGVNNEQINQQAHVEPAKEALIKLVGSFASLSIRSFQPINLFKRTDAKDEVNLLKVFQFIYDNNKYPSSGAILNGKQAFLGDMRGLITHYDRTNSKSDEETIRMKSFEERIQLIESISQKNLLERSQDILNSLAETVDELISNRGNQRELCGKLQEKLIQSRTMLEMNLQKGLEEDLPPVQVHLTIEESLSNYRKNAGANMFPVSGLKESWQMLLNLQKVVKYLNSEEGEAKVQANLPSGSNLKNLANEHLQNMIQELMEVNKNTVDDLVSDTESISPFDENLKTEDIELIHQIYPKLEKSNNMTLLGQDHRSLVFKRLNEKFCQTLNDRSVDDKDKKPLIGRYLKFLQEHICELTTNTLGEVRFSLKDNSPRFLMNQSAEKAWTHMKTFQKLPNYFSALDPMKETSQEVLAMMSLVVLGKPNFIENLINTESIWSKNKNGQDSLNLKVEDLRLLARLYALYTEGFKPSGESGEEKSQHINARNQSLTKLKDKILRTLNKHPDDLRDEITSFGTVLKDCFMKSDARLSDEDFGYTHDFIELVGRAFDPYDNSIKAIY